MDNLTYTVELQRQPGEKFGFKLNGSDDPNKKIIISEIKPNGPAARYRKHQTVTMCAVCSETTF